MCMFLQVADYANNKPPVDLSSFINIELLSNTLVDYNYKHNSNSTTAFMFMLYRPCFITS